MLQPPNTPQPGQHARPPQLPSDDAAPEARLDRQLGDLLDRLKQLPTFVVPWVNPQTGQYEVLYTCGPEDWDVFRGVLPGNALVTAGAQLQRWWRFAAEAKRVWQQADTRLRTWKSAQIVAALTPPAGAVVTEEPEEGEAKKGTKKTGGWKAPPQWQAEAMYRAHPDYGKLNALVESAEAAHTTCLGVIDAWQTIGKVQSERVKG